MSQSDDDARTAGMADMFDADVGTALVCRVCGSLVAASDTYREAHWDWHEASNGA